MAPNLWAIMHCLKFYFITEIILSVITDKIRNDEVESCSSRGVLFSPKDFNGLSLKMFGEYHCKWNMLALKFCPNLIQFKSLCYRVLFPQPCNDLS